MIRPLSFPGGGQCGGCPPFCFEAAAIVAAGLSLGNASLLNRKANMPRPSPKAANENAREWTQDEIDDGGGLPFICPVTSQPCMTEQDEFCEDYGCARKAGIDVERSII